jgi:hypothetical protein
MHASSAFVYASPAFVYASSAFLDGAGTTAGACGPAQVQP